jgi:proteasome lid subunit RPN8/RPN11
MITIPVVESCPYTASGTGVLKLSHEVIKVLAGAVYDKLEWIALLEGTRSENGLEVSVTGLRIPLQERSHAACELVRQEPLGPEIVGVVHSHHNMRAFFSVTDHDTLNTRFPLSIVVAQPHAQNSKTENLFGFSYLAEGRAQLPCGSTGIVQFIALPDPIVALWPETPVLGYATPNDQVSLYGCPLVSRTLDGLTQTCTASCGVVRTEYATVIFGRDSKEFIKEVQVNTRVGNSKYHNMVGKNGGVVVTDNRYFPHGVDGYKRTPWERDDDFIRHWGVSDY